MIPQSAMKDSTQCIRLRGQKTPSQILIYDLAYDSTFGLKIVFHELRLCFQKL